MSHKEPSGQSVVRPGPFNSLPVLTIFVMHAGVTDGKLSTEGKDHPG